MQGGSFSRIRSCPRVLHFSDGQAEQRDSGCLRFVGFLPRVLLPCQRYSASGRQGRRPEEATSPCYASSKATASSLAPSLLFPLFLTPVAQLSHPPHSTHTQRRSACKEAVLTNQKLGRWTSLFGSVKVSNGIGRKSCRRRARRMR
jgi:hypothetical protein